MDFGVMSKCVFFIIIGIYKEKYIIKVKIYNCVYMDCDKVFGLVDSLVFWEVIIGFIKF